MAKSCLMDETELSLYLKISVAFFAAGMHVLLGFGFKRVEGYWPWGL
ncbi:hypothetical protein [Desulfosarcina ovata]|nr:hypothetical protein [Desulfosarcina ovata]